MPLDPDRLETLVLARLLPAGTRGMSAGDLKDRLKGLLEGREPWRPAIDAAVERLTERGHLDAGPPLRATGAGREELARRLGCASPPTSAPWRSLVQTHLVALALGLPVPSSRERERFREAVLVALLERSCGAEVPAPKTLTRARDALAWRELERLLGLSPGTVRPRPGFRDAQARALLAPLLGVSTTRLDAKRLLTQIAARAVGAPRAQEIRKRIVQRYLAGEPIVAGAASGEEPARSAAAVEPEPDADAPGEDDLPGFAARVREAARASAAEAGPASEGPDGSRKVFIGRIRRRLERAGRPEARDESRFKRLLADANRHDLLALARADLVEAFDADEISASAVADGGAEYHFVRLPPEAEA